MREMIDSRRPMWWPAKLFNSIQFNILVTKCGYRRKPFSNHTLGTRGLIESLNNVRIHFSPARVQSWFEDVDKGRSNNESWQLVPWFNDPHGESGFPSIQPNLLLFALQASEIFQCDKYFSWNKTKLSAWHIPSEDEQGCSRTRGTLLALSLLTDVWQQTLLLCNKQKVSMSILAKCQDL